MQQHSIPFSVTPIVSAYERRLESMSVVEFAAELTELVSCLTPGSACYGESVERFRLYRRVMVRRMSRS